MQKEALEKAYIESVYKIYLPLMQLTIGESHTDLDTFLIDNNAYSWAFVSAYNPFSKPLSNEENEQRHRILLADLKRQNFVYCEGEGVSTNTSSLWTPEKSVLILDIPQLQATVLAQKYEQNAIVYGRLHQKAQLVWCVS